jgi:hypothetical protein
MKVVLEKLEAAEKEKQKKKETKEKERKAKEKKEKDGNEKARSISSQHSAERRARQPAAFSAARSAG